LRILPSRANGFYDNIRGGDYIASHAWFGEWLSPLPLLCPCAYCEFLSGRATYKPVRSVFVWTIRLWQAPSTSCFSWWLTGILNGP